MSYFKLMYTMRRMEITCDTEYKVRPNPALLLDTSIVRFTRALLWSFHDIELHLAASSPILGHLLPPSKTRDAMCANRSITLFCTNKVAEVAHIYSFVPRTTPAA